MILTASLVGCPTKHDVGDAGLEASVDATTDVLVCDDVIDEVITRDNWQLVLPIGWTEQTPLNNSPTVAFFADNKETMSILLLTKESYVDSFDQFAIETIRGLRGQGAEVLITASTSLNDEKFIYVRTKDHGLVVDTWLTTKDEFGYSLNCGGKPNDSGLPPEDCQSIADSFKLQ